MKKLKVASWCELDQESIFTFMSDDYFASRPWGGTEASFVLGVRDGLTAWVGDPTTLRVVAIDSWSAERIVFRAATSEGEAKVRIVCATCESDDELEWRLDGFFLAEDFQLNW
ncbi:MAG: hypothetical protein R3F20_09110 [Planctomycetota bacterium]